MKKKIKLLLSLCLALFLSYSIVFALAFYLILTSPSSWIMVGEPNRLITQIEFALTIFSIIIALIAIKKVGDENDAS